MNIFQYAAAEEAKFEAMASESGYERITTFFSDLSIAEVYGINAIRETYENVSNSWIGDYKFFTEFIMSLNWKIWEWYDRDDRVARVYDDLWRKAEALFLHRYEDDEKVMTYYYEVTD